MPAVSRSRALAERLEKARLECRLSEREAGRRLKNPTHYKIAIGTLRAGRSPTQATIDRIVDRFVEEGYRAAWLLTGEPPEREPDAVFAGEADATGGDWEHLSEDDDVERLLDEVGPRVTGGRRVDRPNRYAYAPAVVRALVEEGIDPMRAKAATHDVAFDEGYRGSGELDLYRAVKRKLLAEDKPSKLAGERPVEDEEGEVRPKGRGKRKR